MQAKSFIDILASELRKEIRAEVEAELAASRISPAQKIETSHKADQVLLWLNLRMGGAFIASAARPASAYQSASRKTNPDNSKQTEQQTLRLQTSKPTPERKGLATTIEQTFAIEFLRREGSSLGTSFTETELKSEFRKIALRIHPDRHAVATAEQIKNYSARFQTLVESVETLEAALR